MKTNAKKYIYFILVLGLLIVSCKKNNKQPDPNITYTNPDIVIDSVVNLNNTSARVYVNVLSIGGGDSLESIWASYHLEGQNNNYFTNSNSVSRSIGTSFFDVTGLQPGNNYVVTLNVSNAGFKNDSDSASFTTLPPVIGQAINGGKCAYILQPGDTGYDPNVAHGFYVSWNSNQWTQCIKTTTNWGCSGNLVGSNSTLIGDGDQNSIQMHGSGCMGWNNTGNALFYCYTYQGNNPLNTQSQWFLPSTEELLKIYQNRTQIGLAMGAGSTMNYWSSTESDANKAWVVNLLYGSQYPDNKVNPQNQTNVLAIKYF